MQNSGQRSRFLITTTCFGLAFLYIPMVLLVIYSFNYSKLVPVWGGWSIRWYKVLFESEDVWEAVALSLKVATVNACFATLLGTLAGLALVRFGSFKGRTLFSGMITAPLVMPEVITGLSLLLLFITLKELIGWPDKRGFTTITIAHITFSMAYVAVIIQSRLAGMSQDLEEAAQDLGASRTRAFWDITVPLAKPGIIAGCMLVFIPAIGEYVIPYLLGGPESLLIGRVLFDEFFINRDWPLASAVAIVLLLLLVIPIVILQRNQAKGSESAV